jgi:hypothetical protein
MPKKITIDSQDALALITMFKDTLEKGMPPQEEPKTQVSGMAAYLLTKFCDYQITDPAGALLEKSALDEITLDFTRGRTLSEEEAEIAIRYIYDTNPYLSMFNTRIVKKLVTPVEGTAITQKNLISNEQLGSTVSVINRRIVHNFGVNMYLRHAQLQKDIPLQTVIDNLHNPGWEQGVINDVAIALGNDILLLALNGLGGSYASTQDFYDLNLGFNKMLQVSDGVHTNTYGDIKIKGFLGRYLTPQKVDASGATGTDYNAANLLAVMRKVYKAMPRKYRDNPNNVFLMSQADLDLYVDSRSDMTSPSNTTREEVLNTGKTPNFMGHRIVSMPGWIGINETHESDSNLYGSIVFGDLKNMDVAADSLTYRKNLSYNARASLGPSFEYTYDMYLDFQASKPESFVIAFKNAKVSDPILVTADDAKNGINGIEQTSANTYALTVTSGAKYHLCCANEGAVIVKCATTLASATTLAEALAVSGAAIVPQNGEMAYSSGVKVYVKAFHPNMLASDQLEITLTNA